MRKWAKEHGLLLANAGLFLAFDATAKDATPWPVKRGGRRP
ncbi:MAG: hypothetical protein JWR71_1784 [Pseudarthrobacter sp.]|nr:hypothetical protein [Pseudarthrobacter sp.]